MKNILFVALLLIFSSSGCTNNSSVSLASNPTPPPGNRSTNESSEVHDPPPLLGFPKADGFVNDFAGILDAKDKAEIESTLRSLQTGSKIDFAIAIVKTTGERSTFDYSLAMAKEWKIGSENGGILLLVAVNDRKWWIQIDKKLQQHLPDAEVKKIGDVMVPDFKAKKYGAGIKKCVEKMIEELERKQVSGG